MSSCSLTIRDSQVPGRGAGARRGGHRAHAPSSFLSQDQEVAVGSPQFPTGPVQPVVHLLSEVPGTALLEVVLLLPSLEGWAGGQGTSQLSGKPASLPGGGLRRGLLALQGTLSN